METVELVVTEPRDVYKAMLDLIKASHWTTDTLACPVYGRKKVRVPDTRYPVSSRNKSGFRYLTGPDMGKPPVKFTYCLVGLLLRVVFPEDFKMEGECHERPLRDEVLTEETFRRTVPNSRQLLEGLWAQLPDTYYYCRPKKPSQDEMVEALESWNDQGVTKEDVTNLIQRAYDAASAA